MSSLALLPLEIQLAIFDHLRRRRDFLALALSCTALHTACTADSAQYARLGTHSPHAAHNLPLWRHLVARAHLSRRVTALALGAHPHTEAGLTRSDACDDWGDRIPLGFREGPDSSGGGDGLGLLRAALQQMRNLNAFAWVGVPDILEDETDETLATLQAACPRLRRLHLAEGRLQFAAHVHAGNRPSRDWRASNIAGFTGLTSLHLALGGFHRGEPDPAHALETHIRTLLDNNPALTSLALKSRHELAHSLLVPAADLAHLTRLTLSGFTSATEPLVRRMPVLEWLAVEAYSPVFLASVDKSALPRLHTFCMNRNAVAALAALGQAGVPLRRVTGFPRSNPMLGDLLRAALVALAETLRTIEWERPEDSTSRAIVPEWRKEVRKLMPGVKFIWSSYAKSSNGKVREICKSVTA